ncbi:hypothetical protein [Streptomyces sp. H27-C3]|nr:hypothetical protein [Streptomyces sp. H27-C3]MDJ0463978.1 hypothetical protein [Streptomyces sp. H27-C3]
MARQLAEFPGGHVGYAKWPAEFVGRLVDMFAPRPGAHPSGDPGRVTARS